MDFVCRERLLAQQLNARLITARNYATSLLTSWEFDSCREAVIVFCSKDDTMVGSCFVLINNCVQLSFLEEFLIGILLFYSYTVRVRYIMAMIV